MADEIEGYLWSLLGRIQKSHILRNIVAAAVLLGLLGLVGKFVYDLLPRHYALTITGGDLLGSRHYLARIVQSDVGNYGVSLKIVPTAGSEEALVAVNDGKLDLALIQGGLDNAYPNVEHVTTLPPELIHFMVRPNIQDITQIKGKLVNLGAKGGGTRIVSKEILRYSGLADRIDYVETNYSAEDLIAMRPDKLPDVIVLVSYAPNDVAEFLVKERGYTILEMAFPRSLAVRLGWVADTRILGYMYSITPAVPAKDIEVVGVNLHLVANKSVEPRAISRVLESLYSVKTSSRFGQKITDADILTSPGFPVSGGTEMYMARNDPFIPTALFDKLKAAAGLAMSVASAVLIAWRWYRAKEDPPAPELADGAVKACLARVADIDRELTAGVDHAAVADIATRLVEAKREIMDLATGAKLADPSLIRTALLCIADTRRELDAIA